MKQWGSENHFWQNDWHCRCFEYEYYSDVIMTPMASQVTVALFDNSTVCSGADQRKHQSSVSLAFVRGIHWWPVNSPHKGPVTRKIFDDVIIISPWSPAIHHRFDLSRTGSVSKQLWILKSYFEIRNIFYVYNILAYEYNLPKLQ